jgi:hypothetical protein
VKQWQDFDRKDLEGFICVLFVCAFCHQKKEGQTIELVFGEPSPGKSIEKKGMSGHKFFTMLWYLHCCSMDNIPVGDNYDPMYKV